MAKKIKPLNILRVIVQIAFLILLPGIFIMALDGIKQLYIAVLIGNFSFTKLYPQFIAAIAVIPFTMLLGRFFCGWMCAFGTFVDLLYTLPHIFIKQKIRVSEKTDKLLKMLKYAVLILVVVFVWTLHFDTLNILSPWDAFAQLPYISLAIKFYAVGCIVLFPIIIASMLIERFFCRYLCPLGAIFSIISKVKMLNISKPTTKCGKCRVCTQSCPMAISLYRSGNSHSGECIGCMKCIQACPRKNVSFGFAGESINPALVGSMAIGAIIGLYGLENLMTPAITSNITSITQSMSSHAYTGSNPNSNSSSSSNSSAPNNSVSSGSSAAGSQNSSSSAASSAGSFKASSPLSGKYVNGTYSGVGTGYRPNLNVTVTVTGGKISQIVIGPNNETRNFSMMAFRIIPQEIISSQSPMVDAVSGATRTSNGLISAVSNALKNALVK